MREILRTMEAAYQDVAIAARVLGMVSPWKPSLTDAPEGAGVKPQPVRNLAVPGVGNKTEGLQKGQEWRFPFVEDAVEFLREKQIELEAFPESMRKDLFQVEGITDGKLLTAIRAALVESTKEGESLQQFRKRLQGVVALPKAQSETLYRTETHRSYIHGLDEALQNPVIRAEFPYVVYVATSDNRVRDTHWDMDGEVALVGSSKHEKMLALLEEWNCRCVLIPITAKEAAARGYDVTKDGFDARGNPNLPKVVTVGYGAIARITSGMRKESRDFWKNEIGKYPKNGQLTFVLLNELGSDRVSLRDGRHRLEAAEAAGWSEATGVIEFFNQDGSKIGSGKAVVKFG